MEDFQFGAWLRASFDRPPRKTTVTVPDNLPRGREKPPNESRRNPTLAPSEPQASPHRHNQVFDSMQPDLETDMEVEQNPGNTNCTPPRKSTIDLFNDHLCEIDQAINYIPEKVNIEEQTSVLVHNFPSQLNAIKTPSAQIMQPDSIPRTPLGDISNGLTNPTSPKQGIAKWKKLARAHNTRTTEPSQAHSLKKAVAQTEEELGSGKKKRETFCQSTHGTNLCIGDVLELNSVKISAAARYQPCRGP